MNASATSVVKKAKQIDRRSKRAFFLHRPMPEHSS